MAEGLKGESRWVKGGDQKPVVIYETTSHTKAFFVFATTYLKLVLGTMKARLSEHK